MTVTFGGLKPVHALGDCGRVELVDIGLELPPTDLLGFEAADVRERWPLPGPRDDKYTQGVTGILAGSATYPGAAILSTGAAVAATSGMVRYAGSAAAQVLSRWPEVIASPTAESAGRVQAWVVGPGIGTDDAGAGALWFAMGTDLPVIVDADALTILAAHPDAVVSRSAPMVLTPHAGKFARLAARRPATTGSATRALADKFGATVLLKGNVTVIADPGEMQSAQFRGRVVGGHRRVRRRAVRDDRRAAGPRAARRRGRRRGRVRPRPRREPVGRRPRPQTDPHVGVAHPRPHPLRPRCSVTKGPAMPLFRIRRPRSPRPTPGGCPPRRSRRCGCPTTPMDPDAAHRFIHDEA